MIFAVQVCRLLSEWISFLLLAVPPRSRRTFVELLCGCLMSQDGWLTRVVGVIGRRCHWTTYFKLIERGSIKIQALANQLLRLLIRFAPVGLAMVVVDDTLVMRWSACAPGAAVRREHSRKPNRPRFANAQCWVTIGLVMALSRRRQRVRVRTRSRCARCRPPAGRDSCLGQPVLGHWRLIPADWSASEKPSSSSALKTRTKPQAAADVKRNRNTTSLGPSPA
jgi:hypothetical protein